MKKILFPGTFDPPTLGHLNIIQKASHLFDYVYVGVGINSSKTKTCLFSQEERVQLLKDITDQIPNVEVLSFSGLVVDCAREIGAQAILRSIRNMSDFDSEVMQAHMNRHLGNIETLYMMPDEKYQYISSSLVKEIAQQGRHLDGFVPVQIETVVFQRLHRKAR